MEMNNSLLINRFFTRNTFKEIIEDGFSSTYSEVVDKYVADSYKKTNSECIREIYSYLKNNYRNEYYYKNTLLNKLLLGLHSVRTTTALTEVPIAKSKADFILINGKAVVYEIKTPLDNFDRLMGQIEDYYKVFTRVVVVTGEDEYSSLSKKLLGLPVGICVLTKRGTLSLRKEAIEFKDMLNKTEIFSVMRKNEYENVLSSISSLPNTTQCRYYRVCREMFESIDLDISYNLFIRELKKRSKVNNTEFKCIPYELKFLAYFSEYKEREYGKLYSFLNNKGG